jgi:predicted NAD-dependent protein-ADP-ribosyltransferase YbiA (DUF1768 family)
MKSIFAIAFSFLVFLTSAAFAATPKLADYPSHWWKPVPRDQAPTWEILPQDAAPGEVILSKRNELGILSNFAATEFTFRGKTYSSLEGFWQAMKFPEGPEDARLKDKSLDWKFQRSEVEKMTAFDAKNAGKVASDNMKKLGINWVSFEGKKMDYKVQEKGPHYDLIVEAMKAKLEQNPEVKKILLQTGSLILRPDHKQDDPTPPAWKYHEIWMEFRKVLASSKN